MGTEKRSNKELENVFYSFVEYGLHGQYEEALSLLDDSYIGVGMGEQGIVRSKDEAREILKNTYLYHDGMKIDFSVKDFTIHILSDDIATMIGEVHVYNTPLKGNMITSEFMQTIGVKYTEGTWRISFTHASINKLTSESIEAYPIRFMDNALSKIKEDIQNSKPLQMDSLTGVLNREGFEQGTEEAMKNYNPKHNTALFMIDLDDFKQINDRLGHQVGDTVLQQVAKVLRNTFRSKDAVGRIGGDEFMVLITGDFSSTFLEKKADELMHAMRLQVSKQKEMPISVSIGIAYGRARTTFEKLYHIADMAMYSAKKAGKRQYHIFNADTNSGRSYSASGVDFISLQSLLEDIDDAEALQEKTPYEALLENIPGGVVIYEFYKDEIKVNHCNEWFRHFLGYTEEEIDELQLQSPFVFIHPDDMDLVSNAINSIRNGADTNSIVYRVRRKDGSYVYMNQVTTVTERRKDCIIIFGIETDVDQVIQLKQEVENARKELEILIENVPGSVVMFEINGDNVVSTYRNQWLSQLLGYSQEELLRILKENPQSIYHSEDISKLKASIYSIHTGEDHNSTIFRVRQKNGTYRHLAQSVTVISRDEKNVLVYGIQTDIEETYRLKQKVEESQQELETLIDTIPGGILSISIKDSLTLVHRNEWAARFLGYTKEELQAIEKQDPLFLVHPEDISLIQGVMHEFMNGVNNANFIYRLLDRQNVYRYVRITASIVQRKENELIYYGVITDVNEMIQIQKELEFTNQKLEVLLTTLPGGIATYEISETFKVTNFGDWVYKFTGYQSEEELEKARNKDQLATVYPDDLERIRKEIERVEKEEIDRIFQSIRIVCKDGNLRWMNIHGSVIERKQDQIIMYVIYTDGEKKKE